MFIASNLRLISRGIQNYFPNKGGYILAVLSQILTSVGVIIIKQLKGFSGVDIAQLRTYYLLLMNWPLVNHERQNVVQPLNAKINKILVWRSFICGIQIICWMYSIRMINLSDSMVLSNTTPIWNILIYIFMGKQKIDRQVIVLILASFAGIVMIARSSYYSRPDEEIFTDEEKQEHQLNYLVGCICSVLSSVMLAYAFYWNHLLNSQVSVPVLLHYFYMGTLIVCGVFNIILGQQPSVEVLFEYKTLILFSILSLIMYSYQFFQNWALSMKPSYQILPFHYLQTVNGFLSDWFLFNVNLTPIQIFGSLIIVTCCILIQQRDSPKK